MTLDEILQPSPYRPSPELQQLPEPDHRGERTGPQPLARHPGQHRAEGALALWGPRVLIGLLLLFSALLIGYVVYDLAAAAAAPGARPSPAPAVCRVDLEGPAVLNPAHQAMP